MPLCVTINEKRKKIKGWGGGGGCLNSLLLLSHTLLNRQIVMWVVLPQIPSGLYLFTFPSFHFPTQALGRSLISLDGLLCGSHVDRIGDIFFSDRQIRHTESLVTVGFQAVGLHHIIASNVQHSCLVIVTLASSGSLLSCFDNLFCTHIPPSDYFLCSMNTQQTGSTVVMFFMATHMKCCFVCVQ